MDLDLVPYPDISDTCLSGHVVFTENGEEICVTYKPHKALTLTTFSSPESILALKSDDFFFSMCDDAACFLFLRPQHPVTGFVDI